MPLTYVPSTLKMISTFMVTCYQKVMSQTSECVSYQFLFYSVNKAEWQRGRFSDKVEKRGLFAFVKRLGPFLFQQFAFKSLTLVL